MPEIDELQAAARILSLDVVMFEMRRAEDIAFAFAAFKSGAEAIYVCTDPLVLAQRARINTLAVAARLPTIYGLDARRSGRSKCLWRTIFQSIPSGR